MSSRTAAISTVLPRFLACEEAGITVTLPKPMTLGAKSEGQFGKQDFRYVAEENVYICPPGERLSPPFHERGTWAGSASLLDQHLPELPHQGAAAPPAKSDGSRVGSMSRFSRPFSAGSTSIRKKCASGVRRSSILSERSRPGWEQLTS